MEAQTSVSTESLHFDLIEGPERMSQFAALVDRAFQVPTGSHFLDDFPIWKEGIGPSKPDLVRVGIFHGDELIACTGVRRAMLHAPTSPLSVALIGAVATSSAWRGKGLASRVVSLALQWAQDQGVALALLWGSEHALYQRLGFELCGEQIRLPIAAFARNGCEAATDLHAGWAPGIFTLQRTRHHGLFLTHSDRSWVEAHKNVRWIWTGSDPEKPKAFIAIGRGIDLQGYIHEWGGNPTEVARLLKAMSQTEPELQLLASPRLAHPLGVDPKFLSELPVEFLCMAKIFDPVQILSAHVKPDELQASWDGSKLMFALQGGIPTMAYAEELQQLLFGPGGDPLESGFAPLPLWIWGIDAV